EVHATCWPGIRTCTYCLSRVVWSSAPHRISPLPLPCSLPPTTGSALPAPHLSSAVLPAAASGSGSALPVLHSSASALPAGSAVLHSGSGSLAAVPAPVFGQWPNGRSEQWSLWKVREIVSPV